MTEQSVRTESYQPLARKYRPAKFSQLVGQDSVAAALANAIKIGREPHGVIFAGVRGIGKTTTARLYAKALNCEQGPTSDPCGTCASCLAITIGSHEDVLEIDGASNTGVDDVRALRETVGYVPQRSKFKVYIIDEVHMLSQSAFNALLKTLEEPPRHVVFVFATTELHRIPATIAGRCQVFHLRKLTLRDITERMALILRDERIEFDQKALQIIAREGHGSMRDALTLLDQVIALGGGRVSEAVVASMVMRVSNSLYIDMLAALVERSGRKFIDLVAQADNQGADFQSVAEELAQMARHAFVIRDLGAEALNIAMLDLDDAEKSRLVAVGKSAQPFDLNRIFRTFARCRQDMDGSVLDRFVFENFGLEWCFDPGLAAYVAPGNDQRVVGSQSLQAATVSTNSPTTPQANATPTSQPATAEKAARLAPGSLIGAFKEMMAAPATPVAAVSPVSRLPESWRGLVEAWKQHKPLQARKLEEVHPLAYGPDRIAIAVPPNSMAAKVLLNSEEQKKLCEVFRELFDFQGLLEVSQQIETAPESILQERAREIAGARAKLVEDVKASTMTRDALAIFGGKVEGIRITEPELRDE